MSGTDTTIAISFPDLTPAEASIAAQELATRLAEDGMPTAAISRARASAEAQDLGSIVLVAGGAYLIDLAKEAGKEFVKGAAGEAGKRALAAVLRKWGRAEVRKSDGAYIVLGEDQKRIAAPRSVAQAQRLSELDTLGLVILGASRYPHFPKLDNPAFSRSAELARKVISRDHTVFRDVQVLDLFDQDLRPDAIVDAIEEHVTRHPGMRDVVLYYCGHGDFLPDRERTFYLMLAGTRPGREAITGLGLKNFRLMVEQQAHLLQRRCTFIIDSCFAGAAVEAFQSTGIDYLVEAQVRDILPSRGMALLTAADKSSVAIGRDGEGSTMFTGALAEVLTGRGRSERRQLSLSELCADVVDYIKARHGLKGVIPQCHAPRQEDGDVSRVPMFLLGVPVLGPESVRGSASGSHNAPIAQPPPLGDVLRRASELERAEATINSKAAEEEARQREASNWVWAEQEKSLEAYEQFLAAWPHGRFSGEARKRFAALKAPPSTPKPSVISKVETATSPRDNMADILGRIRNLAAGQTLYARDLTVDDATTSAQLQEASCHSPFEVRVGGGKNDRGIQLSPGQSIKDAPFAPEMVLVPPGRFFMGSDDGDPWERPRHKVSIGYPILVGKFPITFDEWDAAVEAGGTAHKPYDLGWGRDRRPVIDISWRDADTYVNWLSKATGKTYRLLTEAEWEYCARAGTTTAYSFGDSITQNQACFATSQTTEVGLFHPNAFGLYDMHGNVFEWCMDKLCFSYFNAPSDGSAHLEDMGATYAQVKGNSVVQRVLRGGSWDSTDARFLRSANRMFLDEVERTRFSGFRLARSL